MLEKAIWLGMLLWQRGAGEHLAFIPVTLPRTHTSASLPEHQVTV